MTQATFPETPETLTAEWFNERFQLIELIDQHNMVESICVEPVGDVVGVVGEVVRCHLTYANACSAPDSVVIKFAHRSPENRAIGNNTRMYEREVLFFNHIAEHLDTPKTACYFAGYNRETGGNMVIIEDLHDYDVGDQVTGITLEQAKLVVDNIAPLHARYFDAWEDDFGDLYTIDGDDYIDAFLPGFMGSWENAMNNFPECFDNALGEAMPRYVAGLRAIMKAMGKGAKTLVHGDVRMDNAMFGRGLNHQEPVIMIDWQNIMVSNPLQDLAWMTTSSFTLETRRQDETALLNYYQQTMAGLGIDLSLDSITEHYNIALLFVLNFHMIIAGAFVPSSDRARQMAIEGLERGVKAVTDRGLVTLIP